MDGVLTVDKPAGWTSHDAVAYVRRALGVKKAGHTGTLDPLATGLLVVLVGKATRLARYFEHDSKTYAFVLGLGTRTETLDSEGPVTETCPVPELTDDAVESALSAFRGEISQIPPMYSAVKVGGRALYAHARDGREVERSPRRVTVHELKLMGMSGDRLSLETSCSKGTYIRTLGSDIAETLGSCGHIESLRRTVAGDYTLEGAVDIASRPGREELARHVTPLESVLGHLPAAALAPEAEAGLSFGRQPGMEELRGLSGPPEPGSRLRLTGSDGRLLAVAGIAAGDGGAGPAPKLEVVLV